MSQAVLLYFPHSIFMARVNLVASCEFWMEWAGSGECALGIWRQTIKVIFMVKNDLFGMKMISIKMFYYLLQFNCLFGSRRRDSAGNEIPYACQKCTAYHFSLKPTHFGKRLFIGTLRHTKCEGKKSDKATQKALTLCPMLTLGNFWSANVATFNWLFSANSNSEYGQNTLWWKLHA